MVPYPRLARFNYLQRPKTPLVCILRRNQGGGGVVKQPTLNSYHRVFQNFVCSSMEKGVTIWSPFSIAQCSIYTRNFTCVSQTSGTIFHAFPRTSGQEGSFFFFR